MRENLHETRDFIQFYVNLTDAENRSEAVLRLTMTSRAVIQSSLCDLISRKHYLATAFAERCQQLGKNAEKQRAHPCRFPIIRH